MSRGFETIAVRGRVLRRQRTPAGRVIAVLALLVLGPACALFRPANPLPFLDAVFTGNEALRKSDLLEVIVPDLEGFETSAWRKSLVDDAAYDLERYYNAQGFPFANVSYTYSEPEGQKPRAEFTITEGPRTALASVTFEGNSAFPSAVLARAFESEGLSLFGPDHPWYVESAVRSSADEVARVYFENGYLDAVVSEPAVLFDDDRKVARVSIRIHEGIQHRLVAVEIEGDLVFSMDDLRPIYAGYLGRPYVEHASIEIQGRIEEYHSNRGYADVVVRRIRRDLKGEGQVVLVFQVTPGPFVRVGEVRVQGNDVTRTSFIKKRIELTPGDTYDRAKEHASFRKLYRSGLFESVRLGLAPGDGEKRDLEVEVKEAPSLEVFIEPGYGSYEKLRLSGGVREKNFFGTGRIVQADGSVSQLAQNGKLSFIDPWFFGDGFVAEFSLFGGQRIQPSFTSEEFGSGVTITYDVSNKLQLTGGYSYRYSASKNVDVVGPPASTEIDNGDISSFIVGFLHDTRDVVFAPTKGHLTRATCEVAARAIGSQLSFVRLAGTEAGFFDLSPTTVFAASFRTGCIIPIEDTTSIPIQERYFNGGENTVRSFLQDQLGPEDVDGNPVGGEAFTVFSVELRHQLRGHFHGALFFDIGNVTTDYGDYFLFQDMRMGVGAGLRYELPVGPIRLDGAVNPNPQDGEARGAVHFSVGMAF